MKLLALITALSIILQTGGVTPAHARSISMPSGHVQPLQSALIIERTWDYVQGDKTYRVTTQSLGTLIAPEAALTHNHFAQAPQNATRQLISVQTQLQVLQVPLAEVRKRAPDAGTLQLGLPQPVAGVPARLADEATLASLGFGDWLTVVYFDNQTGQPAQAPFMVLWVKDGVASLADPAQHINPGDSGGGAFYNGQLVGNTWAIYQWETGEALGAFKVALLPSENK